MNSKLYILLIPILFGLCSCSIATRVKKADKKFAIGEYYEASEMYRQTYKRIPSKNRQLRAHVAFMQGESQRIINNSRAASAYKNAIRYQYPDSIVYLRYAQVLQYQGKYNGASYRLCSTSWKICMYASE